MRKPHERPPLSAVILCAELCQRCDHQGWHYDLILSRAGREGTSIRTWESQQLLSEKQAVDLTNAVQKAFWDALLVWGGIHGDLPM